MLTLLVALTVLMALALFVTLTFLVPLALFIALALLVALALFLTERLSRFGGGFASGDLLGGGFGSVGNDAGAKRLTGLTMLAGMLSAMFTRVLAAVLTAMFA
jgi:hypothetical protein